MGTDTRGRSPLFLLLLLPYVLLGGCAYSTDPQDLRIPEAKLKIPLRVGLYLEPVSPNLSENMKVGVPRMLRSLFADVIVVEGTDSLRRPLVIGGSLFPSGVAAVLVPRISESLSIGETVLIAMGWTVVDVRGKLLFRRTVIGEGEPRYDVVQWYPSRWWKDAAFVAFEDFLRKSSEALSSSPWWEGLERPVLRS